MKKLVLRLDDIGRDCSGHVVNMIAYAIYKRWLISLGILGRDILGAPSELVDMMACGVRMGIVEIWNHGFAHDRYDQLSNDMAIRDLEDGHQAILDVIGINPSGFGFP